MYVAALEIIYICGGTSGYSVTSISGLVDGYTFSGNLHLFIYFLSRYHGPGERKKIWNYKHDISWLCDFQQPKDPGCRSNGAPAHWSAGAGFLDSPLLSFGSLPLAAYSKYAHRINACTERAHTHMHTHTHTCTHARMHIRSLAYTRSSSNTRLPACSDKATCPRLQKSRSNMRALMGTCAYKTCAHTCEK